MAATAEPIEQIKQRIELISREQAREEIASGEAKLIDVREPHEWNEAHLAEATHVPQGELLERIDELVPDTSERVLLYCRTDNRSSRAADALRSLGYDNVGVIERGIVGWTEEDLPVVSESGLSPDQRDRYSRHTMLPEVGVDGQLKLLNSKVLLIGAGGLGSPTGLYLAAAGVGTLGIIRHYDVIVDGADNFPTRYLLNDASVRLRKPVVSASILSFDGQISTFVPYEGPCYRCLYPTPPPAELAPSCSANGVLGAMAGTMGLLQANEVIKLVLGIGEPLVGRLLLYEALGTRFTELKVRRDPQCPICGEDAPAELAESEMGRFPDYDLFCAG